jgi:hypothetical protein
LVSAIFFLGPFLGAMATFIDGIGQTTENELNGTHSIVIAGNGHVAKIRITIGIKHRHQWNIKLAAFEHRIGFSALID